ncbi:MAG: hypothetical protein QW503_02375 [Sulfolobales archaeon]
MSLEDIFASLRRYKCVKYARYDPREGYIIVRFRSPTDATVVSTALLKAFRNIVLHYSHDKRTLVIREKPVEKEMRV